MLQLYLDHFFAAKRSVLVIFLFSLLIRFVFIAFLHDQYYWPDEIDYDATARRLVSGLGYGNWTARGPLYEFFVAAVYWFFDPNIVAIRAVQAVLDSFSCVLLIFITASFFGKREGCIAGFLYAIYPLFIYFCGMLLSESLYIFIFLLFLFSSQRAIATQKMIHFCLSAFLLGLSALCRPISLFFIIPTAFVLSLYLYDGAKLKYLRNAILYTAISFCAIMPWTIRNYLYHGEFILVSTGGGRAFWFANNPQGVLFGNQTYPDELKRELLNVPGVEPEADRFSFDEAQDYFVQYAQVFSNIYINAARDKLLYKKSFDFIKQNLGKALLNYFKRVIFFWNPFPHSMTMNAHNSIKAKPVLFISYAPLVLLALIAVFSLRRKLLKIAFPLFLILIYNLASALFTLSIRYRVCIDAVIVLLASISVAKLFDRNPAKDLRPGPS